jgi:hypothetical protein
MKQIHLLLGGMTGGAIDKLPPTNSGMYGLVRLLAPRLVTVWTWGEWLKCDEAIRDNYKPGNQIIIIGYSGGGCFGVWATRMLSPIPIALFVAYDPSPAGKMVGFLPNVQRAVCYYNETPWMWWPGVGKLGGGRLFAKDGKSPPVIDTRAIREQHLMVQFDQKLHQNTIALINAL